jgi:hypothetical protein
MKKIPIAIALATMAIAGPAAAHPTNILYDSFGACNAALQQDNEFDRVLFGYAFPNNGAAEVDMLNNWQCVYDPDLAAWHIEGQIAGGDDLGNGNGKADPGTNGR